MRLLNITVLCFLAIATKSAGQNWPRFRGPNGSGLSSATTIPVEWTKKDFTWKIKLPGRGHASPVIWGKRIFITSGDEKTGKRYVLCIHADDGRRLWQRTYPGQKLRKHADNSFATATPVVDDRYLYLTWGNAKEYLIIALDHDGKEIWRRDLGPYKSGHGFGASPIVFQNTLIVPNEQNGASAVLGLNRDTGKTIWKAPRRSRATYSTPCIFQRKGQPAQLIFTNYEHGVTSIDPISGKVNWELDVFHKGHVETAISSPIATGDLILATCGWLGVRQELIAVRPPMSGEQSEPKKVYDIHRSMPLCITPLVKDDLLFIWSDRGVVTCADVRTGKQFWQKRIFGTYYSSPVCAGSRLYNITRDGDVAVLAASKQFKILARNPLGEGSHSTPAIAHGRLYLRTFTGLVAVGARSRSTKN